MICWGRRKRDHFVGPWLPWKPNDGTSIHSASRAATDRTERTAKSDGRLLSRHARAQLGGDGLGCQQEHEHDHGARQAHNPGARKGARGSNSTPETMAPTVPPTISSEVMVPVTLPRSAMPNCLDAAMVGVMVPMHVPIPKLTAATMGPRSPQRSPQWRWRWRCCTAQA